MKTKDYINSIIGVLIGIAIIFFTTREILLYDTDIEAVWNMSPSFMKYIALGILLLGSAAIYAVASNKIAFKSDKRQMFTVIFLTAATVLLSWFTAANFYIGSY